MKKRIILLLLLIFIFIPNSALAENLYNLENKTLIYQNNMTQEEIEKEHKRQLEKHIMSLNLKENEYKITIGDSKMISLDDPSDYMHEWGPTAYPTTSGYAGNQPSNGTKFPTGGGFYYSDSGGPTASISVSFPEPFNSVSFSIGLGNSSTSGIFVNVPNTTDYFKLYITKEYEVRPYIIYRWTYINEFVGYQWIEWSSGYSKLHMSTIASAKRV